MSDQVAVIRKKYLSLEPNFQELIKDSRIYNLNIRLYLILFFIRFYRIIPFSMKTILFNAQFMELFIANFLSCRIVVFVQFAFDFQP